MTMAWCVAAMSTHALHPMTPVKPLMRGVLHQASFFIALAAGLALVLAAHGARATIATAIYVASLCALLGTSALYHRVNWKPHARQRMRRLDHAAIFVLIAGTYTPMALTLPADAAQKLLIIVWSGAAIGLIRAVLWITAPKWLVAVLALAMGWVAIFYLPGITEHAGVAVTVLIGIGGALYSMGALAYAFKRPTLWPRVFGYHELFHALVVLAAAVHFAAVVLALPAIG